MKLLAPALVAATLFCVAPAAASAADAYLSPSGNNANPCTAASRCLTLDRGYHVATPGSSVLMAAGTYSGSQIIQRDATKDGNLSDVTFRPEVAGTTVTTGSILTGSATNVQGSHDLTFQNLNAGAFDFLSKGESNITLTDVNAAEVRLKGTAGFTMTRGSITALVSGQSAISMTNGLNVAGVNSGSTDVSFSQVNPITTNNGTSAFSCLTLDAVTNFTLARSKFTGCEGRDILATAASGDPYPVQGTVRIENNLLFPASATTAVPAPKCLRYTPQGSDTKIWHNSCPEQDSDFAPVSGVTYSGFQLKGNVLNETGTCDDAIFPAQYWVEHDLYVGTTGCPTASNNFYARPTSPLRSSDYYPSDFLQFTWIDDGSPTDWPTVDYLGYPRFDCKHPDIGAYEIPVTEMCDA